MFNRHSSYPTLNWGSVRLRTRIFVFDFNSYFEGFSFKNQKVDKILLEDDLWSLIRLNPELLPIGNQQVIPAIFILRLRNRNVEAHQANISLEKGTNGVNYYQLSYPELERKITIHFTDAIPHSITGWEESHYGGYGQDMKMQTSKAELLKTVKTDY